MQLRIFKIRYINDTQKKELYTLKFKEIVILLNLSRY